MAIWDKPWCTILSRFRDPRMKNFYYLSLFLFGVFVSCGEEIHSDDNSSIHTKEQQTKMEAFMRGEEAIVDFKNHFSISRSARTASNRDRDKSVLELIQSASANRAEIIKKYPTIKMQILLLSDQNVSDKNSWVIQNVGLRYLRNLFLDKGSGGALDDQLETKFLLDLLIEHKSIDLDVLADAYLMVKDQLDESERSFIFNYIKELHDKDYRYIISKQEKFSSETQDEKNKKSSSGKLLERRSEACYCVRSLLDIEVLNL